MPLQTIASPTEARGIAYFFQRVTPYISGFFESDDFWKVVALRVGHDAPAVKHALLAVSALHEAVERRNANKLGRLEDGFAVVEYNRAIRCLMELKDQDSRKEATVSLVTCVLFVCLEFMRGNISAAQKHIRSGSAILDAEFNSRDCQSPKKIAETDIIEELSTTFSRMRLQSILFDSDGIPNMIRGFSHHEQTTYHFSSVSEARVAQYDLSAKAAIFIFSTTEVKYSLNVTMSQLATQACMESQFRNWRQSFHTFISVQCPNLTPRKVKASKVLRIQNLVMFLWLTTCLTPDECAFDAYYTEFETIINLASEIAEEENSSKMPLFHFDMGIIPPLHFIGSKCRFPNLRRQILRILGMVHWREGMFDSYRSYRFIHTLMTIEESGMVTSPLAFNNLGSIGLVNQDMAQALPPECARLHFAELGPVGPDSVRQRLTLVAKPRGLFNAPVVWKTWIPTSGPLPETRPWSPRKTNVGDYPDKKALGKDDTLMRDGDLASGNSLFSDL